MIDFPKGINTEEEERVYQFALKLFHVVLNTGGHGSDRLKLHVPGCALVSGPEARRSRMILYRDDAEMNAFHPFPDIPPSDCPCRSNLEPVT